MSGTVSASLARRGQLVTLRRKPATDVICRAFIRDFVSDPVTGGNPQGGIVMRISNDEIAAVGWPGPPRKGDLVVTAEWERIVESCETRRKGEAVAMYVVRLKGG